MKQLDISEEVPIIRRLLTKPTMKSAEDAKAAFEDYLESRFKITDFQSAEGQALCKQLVKSPALKQLLSYMGYEL